MYFLPRITFTQVDSKDRRVLRMRRSDPFLHRLPYRFIVLSHADMSPDSVFRFESFIKSRGTRFRGSFQAEDKGAQKCGPFIMSPPPIFCQQYGTNDKNFLKFFSKSSFFVTVFCSPKSHRDIEEPFFWYFDNSIDIQQAHSLRYRADTLKPSQQERCDPLGERSILCCRNRFATGGGDDRRRR